MFKCDGKKHNFYATVVGGIAAIMVVLSLLIRVVGMDGKFFGGIVYLFNVAIPVLLVGALVLLFTNEGERKFTSKWWIPAGAIFYISGIIAVSRFFIVIEPLLFYGGGLEIVSLLREILNVAGFAILVAGVLESKLWKLAPIGLGTICFAYIIEFVAEPIKFTEIFSVIAVALLLVISLGKEKKILRTLAVIFALISIISNQYDILGNIAYIILAFLMVPAGKIKFDFYFIPGIAFLLMAISALSGFGYAEGFTQVLVLLVFIAAPLLLSVSFFIKRFGILAVIGYGLMYVCLIIGTFYDAGIAAFNSLLVTITPLVIVKAVALVLFGLILFNLENPKNKSYKIVLIVLSVLAAILAPGAAEGFLSYTDYAIYDVQLSMNSAFAIAMFLSALVLVPFKYTKYQSIAKHIFLSIFTLGIWHLIWVYNVTKNLEIVDKDTKGKYTKELLLYIFIPFYSIYWNYKAAYAIDKYAENNGVESKQGTLTFVLSLVSYLVSSILIQSKFNAVELKK